MRAHVRAGKALLRRLPDGEDTVIRLERRRYRRHLERSMRGASDFRGDAELPIGYGRDLGERAVEYGWVTAGGPSGDTLDAGSALNHAVVLKHVLPLVESLTIVTLAPEPVSFPQLGVKYAYGDLRALTWPNASFDTIVCISTLEHIGLDNQMYGAGGAPQEDPNTAAKQALSELLRVTRPGGRVLLTVPFGVQWRGDWVRQFCSVELDDLLSTAPTVTATEAIYRHGSRGWARTDRAGAASARFRDHMAEAVACVRLDLP